MTAIEQLIASINKHMTRNRSRRGWQGLKLWEREIEALSKAAEAELTQGITIDVGPILKGSNQHDLAGQISEAIAQAIAEQEAEDIRNLNAGIDKFLADRQQPETD